MFVLYRGEILYYFVEKNSKSCMVDQLTWMIIREIEHDGKSDC